MRLKRNWIKIAMFYLRDEQLQTMISAASSQQKQHSVHHTNRNSTNLPISIVVKVGRRRRRNQIK